LLFRQGVPPHATYLFKHSLVRDAAYGTLLRQPRRALHARIAETLESQFADVAERQPELLARHCNEAEQIEKAAALWGKSRTAIAGALRTRRSHRAARPCAYPNCHPTGHSRAASRTNQASGGAHNPSYACQRICCACNQGGCRAGTCADRTG